MPKKHSRNRKKLALAGLSEPWLITPNAMASLRERLRADDAPDGEGEPPVADPTLVRVGRIARIDVVGVLTKYETWWDEWCGFTPTRALAALLKEAAADPTVDAIVLVIDSPGGMVDGTSELTALIAKVNAIKPVHAAISDRCCSGGYLLASQCTSISANEPSDIGSIGVYSVAIDDSEFWKELGVKFELISSGGVKGQGADGVVTEEFKAELQRSVNDTRDYFVNSVAAGRGMSVEAVTKLATGETWRPNQAKSLGLIDNVESIDDAIARITKEVQMMNLEQFRAFAADPANADAVKALTESAVTKALDAAKPKAATIQELEAAFPGEDKFVLGQLKAGASIEQAKIAHAADLTARLKAANDENATLRNELAKVDPSKVGLDKPIDSPPPKDQSGAISPARKAELLRQSGL